MTRCDAPANWFCSAVCADEGRAAALRPGQAGAPMSPLILKRAPIGDNQDDYDALENGVVVGRIFVSPTAPQGRQWMWASGHSADSITAQRTATRLRARLRWLRWLRLL